MTVAVSLAFGFVAGAWCALVARAFVARHADGRISDAAVASLEPEHLSRLRAYIAEIDEHERARTETQTQRWGRQRAAQIQADEELRRAGHDFSTPV